MKRRKFLKDAALSALGLPILSASGRLYGKPLSILGPNRERLQDSELQKNKIRLELSRVNLPVQAWEDVVTYASLWENILKNRREAARFRRDPAYYLAANGIPPELLDTQDRDVRMLKVLTNYRIRTLAKNRDYAQFLLALQGEGLVSARNISGLQRNIRQVLEKNIEPLREYFASVQNQMTSASPEDLGNQELQNLAYQVTGGNIDTSDSIFIFVVAALVVVIAVIAAVYISVATNATLVMLAAVFISAAVSMAVTIAALPMASSSRLATNLNKLAALSPEMVENFDRTVTAARLTGQNEFILDASRELISDEIDAYMGAAEEVGLISFPKHNRDDIIKNMKTVTYKAAGLAG